MIRDAKLLLNDDTSLASGWGAGTVYSDTLDFGAANRQPGMGGDDMWLNIQFGKDTAINATGTVTITLLEGSTATPTTTGYIFTTPTYSHDQIEAPLKLSFKMPKRSSSLQYLRLKYVVGTADFTAGTLNAWIGTAPIVGGTVTPSV